MNKIIEFFGIYCNKGAVLKNVLDDQICPYSNKKCFKVRKSDPKVSIGTCTVEHKNENVIICPNRLTDRNQIFLDCLHLLTLHEPGNELYVIPEISIPGGFVDYFLVSAKNKIIKDFVGIELQTVDTTGTVWPERQRLLSDYQIAVDPLDIVNPKSFGMNWKMTAKTILLQLHHKSQTFEHLNKHLVLVVQKPLYNYMKREFYFKHVNNVRLGDTVHFHSYDLINDDSQLRLSLDTRVSTDVKGVAQCLGLKVSARADLDSINSVLSAKLCDKYRLILTVS